MTVLITGSTGTVGREVVRLLADADEEVRALTRRPDEADLPDGVRPVGGDLGDPPSLDRALDGVDAVFLLSPVVDDELTSTVHALRLTQDHGVRATAYLSVIHADRFTDVPHFAAKAAAERVVIDRRLPVTVLRPGYFMQDDVNERGPLQDGHYLPPVGSRGVLTADVGDIGAVAVAALRERRASGAAGVEVLDVVAPERLTGDDIAALWAEALGRPVQYGGDDLDALRRRLEEFAPPWATLDLIRMMERFERDGMTAAPGTDERLQQLLGRPMRTYREFAQATAAEWSEGATA